MAKKSHRQNGGGIFYAVNRLKIVQTALYVINRSDFDFLECLLACTCGNCVTADDILLQALKVVNAATDGSLAQYLGCFLE